MICDVKTSASLTTDLSRFRKNRTRESIKLIGANDCTFID